MAWLILVSLELSKMLDDVRSFDSSGHIDHLQQVHIDEGIFGLILSAQILPHLTGSVTSLCDEFLFFWHVVVNQKLSVIIVLMPVLCFNWVYLRIRALDCPLNVLDAIVHLKHVAHGG